MKRRWLCWLLSGLSVLAQAETDLLGVRSWSSAAHTRYVLDLSAAPHYQLSPDSTPGQVWVDLPDVHQVAAHPLNPKPDGLVSSIAFETAGDGLRLRLDLHDAASPVVFLLPPATRHPGYRLVVDLIAHDDEPPAAPATPAATSPSPSLSPTPSLSPSQSPTPTPTPTQVAEAETARRDVVVAIDAGHGGQDTGAIGPGAVYEKTVTLAIARSLQKQMSAVKGLRPVLTRDGDYFIPLVERREIARRHYHADIFISIHADASPSRGASGASVFALSLKGANTATSRFARALAERENQADQVGGIKVPEHDDVLAGVLADMVVEGSLEHSLHLGGDILDELKGFSPLHSHHVEQAGFAVLKEPGMVSLLVENGFITNRHEERHLIDAAYQERLAHAILQGVERYCRHYPLPGTYFAWQRQQSAHPRTAEVN